MGRQLLTRGLGGTRGKESACQCSRHDRHGFSPWVGKIPWRKKGHPPAMDRGAWWATIHDVAKSRTQLKRLSTHAWGSFAIQHCCRGCKAGASMEVLDGCLSPLLNVIPGLRGIPMPRTGSLRGEWTWCTWQMALGRAGWTLGGEPRRWVRISSLAHVC